MKKLFASLVLFIILNKLTAQNVGIGTNAPTKLLSVKGSVVVDHHSENAGTLDSASLLFGSTGTVGITSNKNASLIGYRGLDLWTGSTKRISITQTGDVGIGLTGPQYKLHVGGEIASTDYIWAGSSLRAGTSPFSPSYRLQVNGGNSYLGGRLFVGGGSITNEQFYVAGPGGGVNAAKFSNGSVLVEDNLTVDGSLNANTLVADQTTRINGYMSIGGNLDNAYRLRVYDGNARIGGDFHATGFAAIGGLPDLSYRLRVYDGNSRFGGDVQVTGTIDAGSVTIDNTLTIGGKGAVRSNGPSSLRIGFDVKDVNIYIPNNGTVSVTANITDFSGTANDIRVLVSHIVADPGSSAGVWGDLIITPAAPDPVTDTVNLLLTNKSGANAIVVGTIYLTTIAKN